MPEMEKPLGTPPGGFFAFYPFVALDADRYYYTPPRNNRPGGRSADRHEHVYFFLLRGCRHQ